MSHSRTSSVRRRSERAPASSPRKKTAAPRKRRHDYLAPNTPATEARQREIQELLLICEAGATVSEMAYVLGISRQLMRYHLLKLAAQGTIVMQLEPCEKNGGIRFRVWDENLLVQSYLRRAGETTRKVRESWIDESALSAVVVELPPPPRVPTFAGLAMAV